MVKKKKELTVRQIRTILDILSGLSFVEVVRKNKIARSTLYLWLGKPAYSAELEKRKKAILDAVSLQFEILGIQAIEKLTTLLNSKNENISLGSVKLILGKLASPEKETPPVNILISDVWGVVRAEIIKTLEPYPELKVSLSDKLIELEKRNAGS